MFDAEKTAVSFNSFNDNNPNAIGDKIQFVFAFMVDEPEDRVVEVIEESANPKVPK